MNRRMFLTAGLGLVGASLSTRLATAASAANFKAVAFDAFSVFDPRPVAALCETLFPGRGSDLIAKPGARRQFEYTWLRNRLQIATRILSASPPIPDIRGRHAEARRDRRRKARAIAAGLYCAGRLGLRRGRGARRRQAQEPWIAPGASLELHARYAGRLRQSLGPGRRLRAGAEHRRGADFLGCRDARAYQLGVDALETSLRDEISVRAPFAGWDAAGRKIFGYPDVLGSTGWGFRPRSRVARLPDATGANLADLLDFVG